MMKIAWRLAILLKCIEGPAAYCGAAPTFSGLLGALGRCSSFWALETKRIYMLYDIIFIYIYDMKKRKENKAWKSEGWSAIFPDFPVMFFLQPVYSNCLQRCEPCKPELARLANAKGNARYCCSYICIITIITISSIIFFFIVSSPAVYKWNKQ